VDAERLWLPLLGRRHPPGFERRKVLLSPGQAWDYDSAEWQGAIVIVERGQVELEGLDSSRYCFGPGDMLWLERLPLRALHNPGHTPTVLVAVRRRGAGP
jgi:hypothetical protein